MRIAALGFSFVMSLSVGNVSATETAEAQQYTIKQSEPSLGSNFRRDIIKAGAIPPNKHYGDLTAEEKEVLKSPYEKMQTNDEPPYPANGLMPILNAVRDIHEKTELQFKGPLTLYVDVDSEGKPKSVSVVQSPDKQITQVAALALMKQTYKPAVCNGTPCAMQYPFHVELIAGEEKDVHSLNPASGITVKPQ